LEPKGELEETAGVGMVSLWGFLEVVILDLCVPVPANSAPRAPAPVAGSYSVSSSQTRSETQL
jgi:hypothetical protein